ncbi:hypothetical protein [Pseudoalteromonas luteoviolacea]|uniref:Uncharacterized protein n=1 Tax=Pseudoalteromonas luteoviolacea S4060-1 TaxID=1365257 RepID=A0A167KWC3_9GAMM|nr:hypothetical protein [Pseudoalteromonas luteoviolacea]KZN63394.1 hypothetical protein N478_03835 [Pseudoalteromonas luteoviolacea S4060-1]
MRIKLHSKEKGYGLSLFVYTLMGLSIAAFGYSAMKADVRARVAVSDSIIERIESISNATKMFYISECYIGDINISQLSPFSNSDLFNMRGIGVEKVEVKTIELPKPHVEIALSLMEQDPVLLNFLIINNASVAADGLSVTIKKPISYSSSATGSLLYRERLLNSESICP